MKTNNKAVVVSNNFKALILNCADWYNIVAQRDARERSQKQGDREYDNYAILLDKTVENAFCVINGIAGEFANVILSYSIEKAYEDGTGENWMKAHVTFGGD